MVDRNRYKRYVKSVSSNIIFYIRQTRFYKWNLERTTRYQQYIRNDLRDLIHYFNKF